jgi:protein disulfide-isomerase
MDFAGSDWCPPCKALYKNVLSSPEFTEYAQKNLVLVDVDFPKTKPLSAAQKQANQALANQFGVDGFPTIIVLSSEGKELNKKTGYGGQTPKAFIADLEKLKSKS